ncbi:hypothetical protein P4O66_012117 [Electrophorus voltai]|uniref:Uncharacterized protein n=1 Tax=Electrophorus voltai TaxID=2609070 RepID=A0AAD8Z7I5_9TELE|nr:hypothetical protein P4O66_012117 [Electrophorus voltai]
MLTTAKGRRLRLSLTARVLSSMRPL